MTEPITLEIKFPTIYKKSRLKKFKSKLLDQEGAMHVKKLAKLLEKKCYLISF